MKSERQAAPLLEGDEDAEDLGAHRGVEHRDRLVADQPVGLEHQRGGDRDPLALAAGELVRVAVEVARRVEPDVVERAVDPLARARLRRCPGPAAAR